MSKWQVNNMHNGKNKLDMEAFRQSHGVKHAHLLSTRSASTAQSKAAWKATPGLLDLKIIFLQCILMLGRDSFVPSAGRSL